MPFILPPRRLALIGVLALLPTFAVQAAGVTPASGVHVPHFASVRDDACARRTAERVRALMGGAEYVPPGPRVSARNRPCK